MNQLNINLSVGRACFTRCRGCYNQFGRSRTLVDTESVIRFLCRARERGIDKVTLCGGDPLSRPDLLTLLERVREIGLLVHLDTVGTALLGPAQTIFYGTRPVAAVDPRRLARLVDLVGIPMDGSSETVFARFRRGRPGLLAEQLRILDVLEDAAARVCVNTVVHRGNSDDVAAIAGLLKGRNAITKWQLFQFAPLGPLGYENKAEYLIDDAEFARARKRVENEAGRLGIGKLPEFKSNGSRKWNYLLVDSEGIAYVPWASRGRRWHAPLDASSQRVVIGDIRDESMIDRILDVVLEPAQALDSAQDYETGPSAMRL